MEQTHLKNKDKIKKLQKDYSKLHQEILNLSGWEICQEPLFFTVGTWDCPKSYCGLCCYNDYKDPIHDYCVFCEQPEERK